MGMGLRLAAFGRRSSAIIAVREINLLVSRQRQRNQLRSLYGIRHYYGAFKGTYCFPPFLATCNLRVIDLRLATSAICDLNLLMIQMVDRPNTTPILVRRYQHSTNVKEHKAKKNTRLRCSIDPIITGFAKRTCAFI